MATMHNIDPRHEAAREAHRAVDGRFGSHTHSTPEAGLPRPQTAPVIARYNTNTDPHVAYPDTIPAGGVVTAGLEDRNNRPYVTVTFPATAERDEVSVSVGGFDEDDDMWSSLDDKPTGFDQDVDEDIVTYLRDVQAHVAVNSDSATAAVANTQMGAWVSAATTAPASDDYSDEGFRQEAADRGATLIGVHGDPHGDLEDNAADALADILEHLRARGVDTDTMLDRVRGYLEED